MGRILIAAAHILCGVSLIAISPVKSIAVDAKSSKFYPSPNPVIKPTESSTVSINRGKTDGDTAGILASAATVSPSTGKETILGIAEQPRRIGLLEVPSKAAVFSAQLENSRSNEESPDEAERPIQQIVPLEVPSRPGSTQAPMGLSPLGYTSPYFHMERPRLGLGLAYIFDEDRREGQDTDTKDQSHEFKERLAIETRGWAYHPALLKYTLRFEPEWSQSIEKREPGPNTTDNVYLPGYFADATILDPKPYTFYLFGNRTNSVVRSAFAASSDVTTNTYGGDVRLKYKVLPTTLGYSHVDLDQSGFFDRQDVRDDYRISARNISGKSNTSLNAIYSDSEQTNEGNTTDITTSNGTLQNTYDFSDNRKLTLNSVLSYRLSDTDFTDSSGVRWNEFLDWRHTDNLRTNYDFSYDRSETGDFDREVTSFSAQLTHLLYENLTTTLGGNATFNDFSGGQENSYEPRLDLLYQRRIPWGNFSLNGGWNYRVTTREGGDTLVPVTDEPQTLLTGVVTLLDNGNVDLNAPITVTDITGTRIFIEDQDYRIIPRDSFVQIERNVSGAIADGQTVLVDYSFFSDPAFDDALFSQTYGIQFFLWKALTLSYRYQKIDQDILSGPTPSETVDDTTHGAEMQFDVKWSNTQLTFEDIDSSSRISSRRWRAQQTFTFRPWRPLFFNIRGFYQQTEFKDSDDTEDFYGLRSRWVWTPARWCRFELEGFYDKVSGDTQERTQTGFNAGLNLNYRIWNGNIRYDFFELEDENSDEKRIEQTLLFEIIRILW